MSLLNLMFHASTAWDPRDNVFLETGWCHLLQAETPAPIMLGNMTQTISQHGLRLIKATHGCFKAAHFFSGLLPTEVDVTVRTA